MVKGITKRVIVVRSPDPRFFEQAVFFLREDLFHREGVSSEQVLAEANAVAEHYLKAHPARTRWWKRLTPLLWGVLGGGVTGLIWGLTMVL